MSVSSYTPLCKKLGETWFWMLYLQVSILKQQPGILRVGPVGSRSPLAYEGLAQNALVLVAGTLLVASLQGHLGNAPEGLLPDGQGG